MEKKTRTDAMCWLQATVDLKRGDFIQIPLYFSRGFEHNLWRLWLPRLNLSEA